MRSKLSAIAALSLLVAPSFAVVQWNMQPNHSQLTFVGT